MGERNNVTQKEQMIFTSLLNSIFEQKSVGDKKSSKKGGDQEMPQSLQTLFQQSLSSKGYPSEFDDSAATANDVEMEMLDKDVRKLPLSSGSLLHGLNDSTNNKYGRMETSEASFEKEREELTRRLSPILRHITNFGTDIEIQEYFFEKILSKAKALDDFEIDETTKISPSSPPVTKKSAPIYLFHVLDTLEKHFDAPEEVITLFELSKRSSIDFYVSACTVEVYNKILEIRWKYYRDLYAIESLLSEMNVNAVIGNEETVKIIGQIHSNYLEVKHGIHSNEASLSLWNKEDSRRMKSLNQYRLKIISASSDEQLLQMSP